MKKIKLLAILCVLFSLVTIGFSFAAENNADEDNLSIDEQQQQQEEKLSSPSDQPQTVDVANKEENQKTEAKTKIKEEAYEGGTIKDIKIQQNSSVSNTLVFTLDKPSVAELRILNFPYRLFVDLPMPYRWKVPQESLNSLPVSVTQGFRYSNPSEEIFRVTVDLTKNFFLKRAYVKEVAGEAVAADPNPKKLYDFNVDITSIQGGSSNVLAGSNSIVFSNDKVLLQEISSIAESKDATDKSKTRGKVLEVKIKNHLDEINYKAPKITDQSRPVRVFIDPGHGGKDPGASSTDKSLKEKDLVLGVAKEVKSVLEKNKEINVILSRDDDYYIPLNDRILWAQHLGAKIFVSIHADKTPDKSTASGLSVYTLSESASDAQTQTLANAENQSDLIAGVNLNNDDTEVNNILLSLSQRVKSNESIDLARSVVDQASKTIKVMSNPIRSAGFAVLKLPSTPSVLVELGFLSNKDDFKNFQQEDYNKKIAVTLSAGIEFYLWKKGELKAFPVGISSDFNYYVDADIAKAIQASQKTSATPVASNTNKAPADKTTLTDNKNVATVKDNSNANTNASNVNKG